MATARSSERETYGGEAPAASSSGMIEGALKVLECRSMADKGDCMHFCVCKISIVRTSYESLQEEMIDNNVYVTVTIPFYARSLGLVLSLALTTSSSFVRCLYLFTAGGL